MEIKNSQLSPVNFSGSIPQHYEKYLGPMFFEPYAIEISNRIDPSLIQFALEIGCGTGRVSRHLRNVIPTTSRFVASDISADMLAEAMNQLSGSDIEWQIIDAQQLPFNDNSIDLVVCCFGYMFVTDKLKAFEEVYRVLKPNGMLLFSTWDRLEYNGASNVYRKEVKKYLQDSLPDSFSLPFSMTDHIFITNLLEQARFSSIKIESIEKESVSQTAKEAAYGLARGGSLYNEIMKRNPLWVEGITARVELELSKNFGAAPMIAPMRAIICQALK